MDNLAILNMPAAPPPKQASGPAQQQSAGKPEASDFASELDRQIAVSDNTSPGPGRDAGKGRETGESTPETETTEHKPVEGQSKAPGTEAGGDRLALVAQLIAAAVAATDGAVAPAAASTTAAATAPTTVIAATGTAQAAIVAGATSAATTVAQSTSAPSAPAADAGQTVSGSQIAEALPQTAASTTAAAPEAAKNDTAPVADITGGTKNATTVTTATATTATATTATATTATAITAATNAAAAPETSAIVAAASDSDAPAVANSANVHPASAKPNAEKQSQPTVAAPAPVMPAVIGQAVQATNNNSAADSDSKEDPGLAADAAKAKPGAKATDAPTFAPAQADRSAAGDELAKLTGHQPGATATVAVAGNDKPPISQPMAHDIVDQLVAGAKMLRQGPVTEMRLQLKPEFLGRVDLKVMMESGVLSARIIVADPQVKAAIEANLSQLKQDLAQQGIALQSMTVGLGGGRNQQTGDPQQNSFRRYEPQYQAGRTSALTAVAAAPQRSAAAGHRLDLVL